MYENGFIEETEFNDCCNSLDLVAALWTQYAVECTITEEEYRQGLIEAGIDIKQTSPVSSNTAMLSFVEYSEIIAPLVTIKAPVEEYFGVAKYLQ
jgi:hypothetical protein